MTKGKIVLTENQKRLIQRLGVSMEQSGRSPAEGKVIALLIVSTETELTFEQIQDTLKLSKSAVSNAINKLLVTKDVEYVTQLGDRKRYFKSRIDAWEEKVKQGQENISYLSTLYKEVLNSRPKSTREFNQNLESIIDFMDFLHSELHNAFEKWQKKKARS